MVPVASFLGMACSLLICLAIPLVGVWALWRRDRRILPVVGIGAVAFVGSQMMLRIPLMQLASAIAPNTLGAFLTSVPVASFSAGIFEETARLLCLVYLLKGARRLIDGVAFGLGHGGIEAILLVGAAMVNNLVLGLAINFGYWDSLAGILPGDAAQHIQTVLVETPSSAYFIGGIERMWAIGLHIVCSILILLGVVRGRKALAWVAAVLVHGTANFALITAISHGANMWIAELSGVALIAIVLVLVVRGARKVLRAQASAH
ncbi:YhfC family glutamic-type intramembrane protease [Corynebacterium epidermidicanis]|uniref:Putative membrane protein n=1 Tax=Corynebacterium epidermidicanis TaxID=1050174 RepID=A0A0G3GL72_9CORY|nr:YhfC family glutamic-type intramembrane protease [Corynebacterium epidermidicanis]AKK01986.1 putative membrane protein [Corynebacterium epidermidicanis]